MILRDGDPAKNGQTFTLGEVSLAADAMSGAWRVGCEWSTQWFPTAREAYYHAQRLGRVLNNCDDCSAYLPDHDPRSDEAEAQNVCEVCMTARRWQNGECS